MRQSAFVLLCFGSVSLLAQTPGNAIEDAANQRIELAQRALDRTKELVDMGALAKIKLTEAEQNLEDAKDDAVLAHTLYSDHAAKNWSDQLAEEGIAAAQRRVEREQQRIDQTRKLIDQGFIAGTTIEPLQQELSTRQVRLNLARSLAQQMKTQAALAQLEESIAASREASSRNQTSGTDLVLDGMEHFEGNAGFTESRDLKLIATAFAREFAKELPISADGETSLHRALGLDHRGRVDVAVAPNTPEGIWLRGYLKLRNIPYYAFTHAMPGKATAAHIHIGPGSTRLSNAD
jgi:hypothetical protein